MKANPVSSVSAPLPGNPLPATANMNAQEFLDIVRALDREQTESVLASQPALLQARNDRGQGPLHVALQAGADGDFIRMLLEAGADVMAGDQDGNTALHTAILCRVTDTIIFPHLISVGGLPLLDATNNEGMSPAACAIDVKDQAVHLAIQKNRVLLRMLSVDDPNAPLWQALEAGAGSFSLAQFQDAIRELGGVNAVRLPMDQTPLMLAVALRRVDLAKWLLDEGANINAVSRKLDGTPGVSALGFALTSPEAFQLLLSRGADLFAEPSPGSSVLSVAANVGSPSTLQMVLDEIAKRRATFDIGDTLIDVLVSGNADAAHRLLAWKPGQVGAGALKSAMFFAVTLPSVDIVATLIKRGGAVNAKDDDGKTLLDHCTDARTRALLMSHGARSAVPQDTLRERPASTSAPVKKSGDCVLV